MSTLQELASAEPGPRICVVGAGAIGGWLAAQLSAAGEDVSVLARGATLARVRSSGLELHSGGKTSVAALTASDSAEELGPHDVVIVAVKAQALPALAPSLAPLLHERTVVLPAINGLPWWYFLPQGVKEQGLRLRSVDPQGGLEKAFPIDNVVAISVFASSSSPEPGVIHHAAGQRLVFGEPAGGDSVRVARLVERFKRAGFAAEQSADVRRDVWNKLLGNACFNPVSLLTLAHTDDMIDDPAVHRLFVRMMDELLALGRRIGIDIAASAADRIATTRKLGHIRTSMLQDLRAGREVEIDAILGAAVECAAAIGAAVPTLDSVLAIAASRARSIGAAG